MSKGVHHRCILLYTFFLLYVAFICLSVECHRCISYTCMYAYLFVYTCLIYVSIDRGIGVNKWVIDRGIDRSISWQVFLFICSKNSHPHAIIAITIDADKANNSTHPMMFHQNLYPLVI